MKRFALVFSLLCAPAFAQLRPAPVADLDAWHERSREVCANDLDCRRIVKKAYDDARACIGGDSVACAKRDRNQARMNRWNAGQTAAQNPAAREKNQ